MVIQSKINSPATGKIKILVAPLDWGLGHATRCIPVIKELLNQRCEVWIAAAGAQKVVLQKEFPALRIVELPGYDIKYGSDRGTTIARLTLSIPKILIRIKQENRWLRDFMAAEMPDIVISDNRYGLHAPGLFSIFMTHQLRIRTPFGRRVDDRLQKIQYRAIGAFSRCWIPDIEGTASLAGSLSHPISLPSVPIRYIGWLSRFVAPATPTPGTAAPATPARTPTPFLLVLLSGPEPQRTLLEQKIIHQATSCPIPITLVRGLPAAPPIVSPPAAPVAGPVFPGPDGFSSLTHRPAPPLTIHDYLAADDLAAVIKSAEYVISRSGYSTIMDLARLKKKAILIPTPGQTEQEYLGAWLSDQHLALCLSQSDLSLPEALTTARAYSWSEWTTNPDTHLLQREIRDMLDCFRIQSAPDLG